MSHYRNQAGHNRPDNRKTSPNGTWHPKVGNLKNFKRKTAYPLGIFAIDTFTVEEVA